MRIAFFTESWLPYISGVTLSIASFTKELQKAGHEVRIYAPYYPHQARHESVGCYRFRSIPFGYPGFRLAVPGDRAFMRDLAQFSPQIIHAHHPFMMGRRAAQAAKKFSVPLVYTFHTLFADYVHHIPLPGKAIWRSIVRARVRRFGDKCDLVIAPTTEAAKALRQEYRVGGTVAIIPTGMDLGRYANADARPPGKIVKLIHVGRIALEKNISFLLRVIKHLPPHYQLEIIGEGPALTALRAASDRQGLAARVTFSGFRPPADLPMLLAQGHIFVSASTTETQGLVFMEAQGAGLPIVALAAAGAKNMIGDDVNGYLCPPDEKLFAEKIMAIANHHELFWRLSRAAKENSKNFSAQEMTARLGQEYQLLLSSTTHIGTTGSLKL